MSKLTALQRAKAAAIAARLSRLEYHGAVLDAYVFISHRDIRTMCGLIGASLPSSWNRFAEPLRQCAWNANKDLKPKVGVRLMKDVRRAMIYLSKAPRTYKKRKAVKRGRYEAALAELRNSPRKPPRRVGPRLHS